MNDSNHFLVGGLFPNEYFFICNEHCVVFLEQRVLSLLLKFTITNYMKKILLAGISLCFVAGSFAQTQIGNSNFEAWENVAGSDQEPVNWNSFLTASGGWAWAAANQIQSSTDVRPGSTGTKSCRINARSAFGIIANGNVTVGQVNMGSTTPTDAANYNISRTAQTGFSEVLTDHPDSLIFWAKSQCSGNARVKATIHDAYNYRDPEDAASTSHVVATAVLNYGANGGVWTRYAVPFNYSGPASTPAFILITFTTNMTPGGGSEFDVLYIDDVSLFYNQAPTINPDSYVTDENVAVVCDVLANDTDPENALVASTVTVTTQPTNGMVSVNSTTGAITYTPNTNYFGTDSFVYSACDNGGPALCDDALVTITINAVNQAPDAVADFYFTPMDAPVVCNVLNNDTDAENAIDATTVSITVQPAHGNVLVNPTTGAITYTPDLGYLGLDNFQYKVCDAGVPSPVLCDSVGVTITIFDAGTNQQMIANNDAISGQHDTQIACNVLANDVDPEGLIDLTSVAIVTQPTNGGLVVDGVTGMITYTPNPGYVGADSYSYSVCDQGSPATCDTAVVTMTVTNLDAGIEDIVQNGIQFKFVGNAIVFSSNGELNGEYKVFDLVGQLVQKGKVVSYVPFDQKSGIYLITIESSTGRVTKRVYKN